MGKFMRYGRVVILLQGRQAGKKAVIVKSNDEGSKDRKFGHCLVAGINKYPRKVSRAMGSKKIEKRLSIKPFVKYVNLNHVMPTRYVVQGEIDLKTMITEDKMSTLDKRIEMKKELSKYLKDKYKTMPTAKSSNDKATHLRFFMKKLRF
eukprot:TRINITY_DN876_c0_g1_i4.p2 TRINITY_DN876_c0_g1~~TRINITY_DN876_c0_g1_i4.p2  ORF type:complete len:149 (-),score=24.19 TRINITY_DN876_c0_g1_i4:76-522(-)